jgi:putative secretion ATPase (PEP-CTERM system associated)
MYESYFNLTGKPFELVPNPEFLFLSKSHKKAITYLTYGIRERIGFILLTGEIGSGKTTILRNLIKDLNDKVVLSKVFNTRVTSEQLLAMINEDFGLDVTNKDRITLLRDLNTFLVEQYVQDNQPILIIDEAQNLTPDLLEEVRLLSNLETERSKLIQIVLVGQPELRQLLNQPSLRQLRQRISMACNLEALTLSETGDYIAHRLEVAGNRDAVIIPPESLEMIFRYSKGIPRLINIICDFLMLSAFAEQVVQIDAEMVREIIGDLDIENMVWEADGTQLCGVPAESERQEIVRVSNNELLETKLTDIADRLTRIESDDTDKSFKNLLIDISERIASLENAFRFHVTDTQASVDEVRRRIARIKDAPETIIADEGTAPPRISLFRRILGE